MSEVQWLLNAWQDLEYSGYQCLFLVSMAKLKVCLHSLEFPTVGFVDKEGAMHACAQDQKTAFERLGSL